MSIYEVNIVADLTSFDYTGVGNEINVVTDLTSFNYSGTSATTEFEITSPTEGQQIPEGNFPITLTFSDTATPDGWRVQIATDSGFANVVFDDKTLTKSIQIDSLGIDVYYAKVIRLSIDTGNEVPIGDDSTAGDIESLELHYDSLGGANWDDNTGWASTGMSLDPAPFGVTTATIGGELRVTAIDLSLNNCIGVLPEFPGLQECTDYRVVQKEAGNNTSPPERITGAIPTSLGQTKITVLALAGRGNGGGSNAWSYRMNDNLTAYNKKYGKAYNQFTGGIPDELFDLDLEYLEIDGQDGQFGGTYKAGMANWVNMVRFYAGTNLWTGYDVELSEANSAWTGPIDYIQSWVNCEVFEASDNLFESIPVDVFQGWNNISRSIEIPLDRNPGQNVTFPVMNQTIPDFSGLSNMRRLGLSGRAWIGEYPSYMHTEGWTNLNKLNVSQGTNLNSLGGGLTNSTPIPSFGNMPALREIKFISNDLTGDLFADANVSGDFGDNIIQFYYQSNTGLTGQLPEGMEDWTSLRYLRLSGLSLSGPLPQGCPGAYSDQVAGIELNGNEFTGGFPDTQSWQDLGINSTRVTYLNLSGNNLKGEVPANWSNMNLDTFLNVSNNRLDFSDIGPTINQIEANAAGFNYIYAPQKDFGLSDDIDIIEGDSVTINPFSENDYTGNLYQWKKNGVNISGETSLSITISGDLADEGVYTLQATNPIAPDLTLESEPIQINII